MNSNLLYFRPNKKREFKNKKFGFGGQKKRSKMNTKGSASDMSEFNPRINQKKPGKSTGKPKLVRSISLYNPVDLLRYYLYWLELLKNLKSSMIIQKYNPVKI